MRRAVKNDVAVMGHVEEGGLARGRGNVIWGSEGLGRASVVGDAVHRLLRVLDAKCWTSVDDRAGYRVASGWRWQRRGVDGRAAWMHHAVAWIAAEEERRQQRQSALWERRERRCPEPLDSLQAMVDQADVCVLH